MCVTAGVEFESCDLPCESCDPPQECSAVGEELQGLADVLSLQEALGGVQNLANISEGGGGQGNSTEDFFCGEAPASDFIKQVTSGVVVM